MDTVDYLKLSEQYAGFLVAVGGVSITVLTLVLSLGSDVRTPTKVNSRSFLVAALVVATVACFIGAHMMAETAAFIEFHNKTQPPSPTGERLFLLATINIFIAIILVLFALMLLPMSSRRVHAASIAPISVGIFLIIVGVAFYWMILAANYRMPVPQSESAIWLVVVIGLLWGILLWFFSTSKKYLRWLRSKKRLRWAGSMKGLLWITFAPSALSTAISLIWFAWIFKEGDPTLLHKARNQDIWFFCFAIALSYAPLVVAAIKTMSGKQFAENDVLGKPKYEQKESIGHRVETESKRGYFSILFASVFVVSTTILLGEVSGVLRSTSDASTLATLVIAVASAIGTISTILITWTKDRRDARKDRRDAREQELRIKQLERELKAARERPVLPASKESRQ